MNEQLRTTLEAVQGGLNNVPFSAALADVDGWRKALSTVPGAGGVLPLLELLQARLENGDLGNVVALLPDLALEVEKLAEHAPAEDAEGLRQLATAFRSVAL